MSRIGSVIKCVLDSGATKETKDRIIKSIKEADWDSSTGQVVFSDADVANLLDEKLISELKQAHKALHQKRVQVIRTVKNDAIIKRVYRDHGAEGLIQFMDDLTTSDQMGMAKDYGLPSVDDWADTILTMWDAEIHEVFTRFFEKSWGRANDLVQQKKWVAAVINKDFSDPEVGALAEATSKLLEKMRQRYNDAGGVIEARDAYFGMTAHDPDAYVTKFGSAEGFAEFIKGKIKEGKIEFYNPANGKPFSGDELDTALKMMYRNVVEGRGDAPLIEYNILMPNGKQKKMSAAVKADYEQGLEAMLMKAVDDKKASRLDPKIEKIEAMGDKATNADRLELAKLKEERSSIISSEQKKQAEAELEAISKGEAIIAGEVFGEMPISMMRAQERSLVFTDADGWIEWQLEMGVKDFAASFRANMDAMSREIALMETFGPDAKRGFDFMLSNIKEIIPDRVQKGGKLTRKFFNKEKEWQGNYRVLSGEVNQGADYNVAKAAGVVRNAASGTLLSGSSFLYALGDMHTVWVTAGRAGTGRLSSLAQYMKNILGPRDPELARLYMGASHVVNSLKSANRYAEVFDAQGKRGRWDISGKSAWYSDIMMRWSLGTHITRQGDMVFPQQTNLAIAKNIMKSWDDLPKKWRKNSLEAFGINEQDWADIQSAADGMVFIDEKGISNTSQRGAAPYFDLNMLDKNLSPERAGEIREKIVYMTTVYRKMSVLQSSVEARRMTSGGGREQDDTFGVIARMMTQFMAFPITYINRHVNYGIRASKEDGYGYLAELFVASTVSGAFLLMIDDIKKGRDPRRIWDDGDPKLLAERLGQAIARGGGLGFYGDLIVALAAGEEGAGKKLMGPGLGMVIGTSHEFLKALNTALGEEDDPDKAAAMALLAVTDLLPTRAHLITSVTHQFLVDRAAKAFDSGYINEKRRRQRRYVRDELGSDYFLEQGDWYHDMRTPEFSNVYED